MERFVVEPGRACVGFQPVVRDRQSNDVVAYCGSDLWASLIADGLNMIVENVRPWDSRVGYSDVLDGEVLAMRVEDVFKTRREMEFPEPPNRPHTA